MKAAKSPNTNLSGRVRCPSQMGSKRPQAGDKTPGLTKYTAVESMNPSLIRHMPSSPPILRQRTQGHPLPYPVWQNTSCLPETTH